MLKLSNARATHVHIDKYSVLLILKMGLGGAAYAVFRHSNPTLRVGTNYGPLKRVSEVPLHISA